MYVERLIHSHITGARIMYRSSPCLPRVFPDSSRQVITSS